MRATVTIDDALYRQLEARAGTSGRAVEDLVEDAVRDSLRDPEVPPARTGPSRADLLDRLPTFEGRGGLQPGVDIYDNAGLRDLMDDAD